VGTFVRLFWSLLLALPVVAVVPGSAAAATFTVNTTLDAADALPGDGTCATAVGQCSLRAAIEEANADAVSDNIVLPSGEYHLDAAGGDLDVSQPLTIGGTGSSTTIIDADDNDRVVEVLGGSSLSLSGLTIRDGHAPSAFGGGLLVDGSLILSGVEVRDNDAGFAGGGVFLSTNGTLTVTRSTVLGNRALDGAGGGINIQFTTTVIITGSTIAANSATQDGGGIYGGDGGTLTLTNSTVSGNRANVDAGGLKTFGISNINASTITANRADDDASSGGDGGGVVEAMGTITMRSTIVAGNTDASPGAEVPDCSGGPVSGGSNLIGTDSGCAYTADPTDRVNTNAELSSLADNGGPTMTHSLNTASPALDGVTGLCEAADQRSVPRPQGSACDIGSYELALCGGATVNKLAEGGVAFIGTNGPDVVLGTNGNDSISLGEGDDRACGGAGDDQLTGGAGNDSLDGGSGTDQVIETGDVDFLLTATVLTGLGTDSLVGIEQATLTGGASANLVDASTFPGPVVLNGAEGDDGLIPGPANDVLDGGPGLFDLVLTGGNVNFKITDTTLTGLGTDALNRIEGAFIVGESAGNKVDASTFNGSLFASGGGGADTLLGGNSPFGDFLLGDAGNDFVRGGHGPDFMFGGRGRDRLRGQGGADVLRGEGGKDSLSGGPSKDRLFGGAGRDSLDGGSGRDLCNGGKQPDTARRCEKVRSL
jgi:CSLREA domain-containing protein